MLPSCSVLRHSNTHVFSQELIDIFDEYVTAFPKIENSCKAKSYYELSFDILKDDTVFCISSWIGKPAEDPIPLGDLPVYNARVLKGYSFYKGCPIVVYDVKSSDGYGVYIPNSLEEGCNRLEEIPEYCGNTSYPEIRCYGITNDSIKFLYSHPGFHLE